MIITKTPAQHNLGRLLIRIIDSSILKPYKTIFKTNKIHEIYSHLSNKEMESNESSLNYGPIHVLIT